MASIADLVLPTVDCPKLRVWSVEHDREQTSSIQTGERLPSASVGEGCSFVQMNETPQAALTLFICIIVVAIFYVAAALEVTKFDNNRDGNDDVCYLRQAHLFRDRGWIRGLNTDSDDGRYISGKFSELKISDRYSPFLRCERLLPDSGRVFLQYPFGTGFLLSLFPPFAQPNWLYVASTTVVFILVCSALLTSRSVAALIAVAVAGGGNLYMMVNPSKASYSIAPTMPICIVLGFMTVWTFAADRAWKRIMFAGAAGLLLGVATDLRLSSSLLAFGFAAAFAVQFVYRRNWEHFLRPAAFALCCLVALTPLIVSNILNGGSPFATGYRGDDTELPDLSLSHLRTMLEWYGLHTHGLLLWSAVALLAIIIIKRGSLRLNGTNAIIGVCVSNLIFNMSFFLTHPILSQYYTIPPTILTIWTIVFAWHASERNRLAKFWGIPRAANIRTWSTVALACGLFIFLSTVISPTLARKSPPGPTTISLEPNAVVWTSGKIWQNPIAGSLEIFFDRHAVADFDTAPPETVDALIAAIIKDKRPQYFVIQNPAMEAISERAAAFGRIQPVGEIFGVKANRLELSH